MSKPKMLGMKRPYTPNNRIDCRKRRRACNPLAWMKAAKEGKPCGG